MALTSTLKSLIEEQTGINEQGGIFCLLGVIQQLRGQEGGGSLDVHVDYISKIGIEKSWQMTTYEKFYYNT